MNLIKLYEAAIPYYEFNANLRGYHNWSHAINVVKALPHTADDSVVLAAYWHDAVYIPGAGGTTNEDASAAALLLAGRNYTDAATKEVILDASVLISQTSVKYHLMSEMLPEDYKISQLLDADLSSLALPYDEFWSNQNSIILENNGIPDSADSLKKCADFLSRFLTIRPRIYHTPYAGNQYENRARSNIQRFVSEVDQRFSCS